jgi:hypothetical protein
MYTASEVVTHEKCCMGECSAMCIRVSNKLVLSYKENVKDNNKDGLPKWRMTYWKCYNTVLLLASEKLLMDFVLPKQHCGEPCMASVSIYFT